MSMKESLSTGRRSQQIPFTMVANKVLNDPGLTWKAKGLFAYLYSKPDNWDFSARRMSQEGLGSVDAIESGLRELEVGGYLVRTRLSTGKMDYFIRFSPIAQPGKALTGKNPPISNTKKKVINNNTLTSFSKKKTRNSDKKMLRVESEELPILIRDSDGTETMATDANAIGRKQDVMEFKTFISAYKQKFLRSIGSEWTPFTLPLARKKYNEAIKLGYTPEKLTKYLDGFFELDWYEKTNWSLRSFLSEGTLGKLKKDYGD